MSISHLVPATVLVLASAAASLSPARSTSRGPGVDRVTVSTTCYDYTVGTPEHEEVLTVCPPLPLPPPFGTAGPVSRG